MSNNLLCMGTFQRSLIAAAVLVLCSLVPYHFAPAEPISGYAMLPGVLFGVYGSAMLGSNSHDVRTGPMLLIASLVNFFFWTLVCYAALLAFRRLLK